MCFDVLDLVDVLDVLHLLYSLDVLDLLNVLDVLYLLYPPDVLHLLHSPHHTQQQAPHTQHLLIRVRGHIHKKHKILTKMLAQKM